MMRRLAGAGLLTFWLGVNPTPASRPRVSRWGTYYSKTYETFRTKAKTAAEAWKALPTDRPLIVMMECIVEKPRTGKLAFPNGDVDNYAKGPLDTLNKVIWTDDTQIQILTIAKRYATKGEEAGVLLEWFEPDLS